MGKVKKILCICQVYEPDPAAVGQYLADVARELVRLGEGVTVLTSREGYDDPSERYKQREILDGVEVIRLPFSSFGKKRILVRLAGQLAFLLQAFFTGLCMRNVKEIVITTVPPMTSIFGSILSKLKRVPIVFWAMDINPDQLIRMGKTTETSMVSRTLNYFDRSILKQSAKIITLDRFMADTLNRKMDVSAKLSVIPLWPLDKYLGSVPISHGENPFRIKLGLQDKFVVMYSGNHSPVNPLDTVIEAAKQMEEDDRFVFVFIGGGQGKVKVEESVKSGARNIISLPYQPLDQLKYSLSAADIHNDMVGVVHPSKIYGILKTARPVISLGPQDSPIAEIVAKYGLGENIEHGNVRKVIATLHTIYDNTRSKRKDRVVTEDTTERIHTDFGRERLCGKVCDIISTVAKS